jgi:hypothetical protein
MTDDSAERAPIGKIDVSGLPGPIRAPSPIGRPSAIYQIVWKNSTFRVDHNLNGHRRP